MKKSKWAIALIITCFFVIVGSVYAFLSIWYQGVFPAFMWIDDIYCTGMTVEEVNNLLLEKHPYNGITVKDISGKELHISPDDIGLKVSYEPDLRIIMKNRGGFKWWKCIYKKTHLNATPYTWVDEVKLSYTLQNWDALTKADDLYAEIGKTENGYEIVTNYGYFPIIDNIYYNVYEAIVRLDDDIDLATTGFVEPFDQNYEDISDLLSVNYEDVVNLYGKINDLQSKEISFDLLDERVALSPLEISSFMLTSDDLEAALLEKKDKTGTGKGLFIIDGVETEISEDDSFFADNGLLRNENGALILSESRIYDCACAISDRYTTRGCMDRYREGTNDLIYIGGGKKGDGSIIDKKALFELIKNSFIDQADVLGAKVGSDSGSGNDTEAKGAGDSTDASDNGLVVSGTTVYSASEKLGTTYIEVDMAEQHLYYYVDGSLSMDMPVVTGNVNRGGRGTPSGIFEVYNKRYHTNLVGVDYVSYVNYWLGVNKGVGIHDATWRKKFGEDIYKRDGSHGCINCPLESVEKLWEVCEVGTPVILHY